MRYLLTALLVAVLLAAAGCSGEPSETDIRAAFEKDSVKNNASLNEAGKVMGGAGKALTDMIGKTEIHAVKKIDCVAAQNAPGFVCDVELDITVPLTGRTRDMVQARLVKGPEGWVLAK